VVAWLCLGQRSLNVAFTLLIFILVSMTYARLFVWDNTCS
jgi:hypothetical protein